MTWHKAKAWDESAFVGHALPELTNAMGLHMVLNDLDHYHESDTDCCLIDPAVVARLRADWLDRALAHFPAEWHPTITNQVATAENFQLALIAHIDQVRFGIRWPRWIKAFRFLAVCLALATVLAIVFAVKAPFGPAATHNFIVAAEVLPIAVAALGLASALGLERFRSNRALRVSNQVRQELRNAIVHGFARPISEVAKQMEVLRELSLD